MKKNKLCCSPEEAERLLLRHLAKLLKRLNDLPSVLGTDSTYHHPDWAEFPHLKNRTYLDRRLLYPTSDGKLDERALFDPRDMIVKAGFEPHLTSGSHSYWEWTCHCGETLRAPHLSFSPPQPSVTYDLNY